MPTAEISRIHITLEISLLLQTKLTKNCYQQMSILGSNAREMPLWLGSDPAGEDSSALPNLLAEFWATAEKGKDGRERLGREAGTEGGKEGWGGKGREERGMKGSVMWSSENTQPFCWYLLCIS